MIGRTGERCLITGIYRCFGNYELKISLHAGECFPTVSDAINAFWILVTRSDKA
jgi:hypothetical protein